MSGVPFKLRTLKATDKNSITRYINNIKIWNQVRDYLPNPYTDKDAEKFIDFSRKSKPTYNWGITVEDEVIGIIGLTAKTDIYRLNGELGFWLAEPWWGKGIVTSAITKVTEIGFKEHKLHRIYAEVFEDNPASSKVLIKNRFRQEAILKEAVIKNNRLLDLYIYARLRNE